MKTRIKAIDKFYVAVEALIERLTAEKYEDDARRLHTLMHDIAWTTGSELLGELVLAFKDMNGKHSHEITREINECLEFATHHRQILGLG